MSKKEEGEMEAGKRLQTHADKAQFVLLRNFKLKLFSHSKITDHRFGMLGSTRRTFEPFYGVPCSYDKFRSIEDYGEKSATTRTM